VVEEVEETSNVFSVVMICVGSIVGAAIFCLQISLLCD
jgi:amino acid permease